MPLIFPSNTLSGGFSVDNSCRFNDGDSAYMYRSNGTPTSQRKLTISTWLKRGTDMATTDYYMYFMGIQDTGVGDPRLTLGFTDSGQILAGENGSPSEVWKMKTNAVYKDPGAWYHIVLSIDTTQATEANRLKIYVNGTQVTSFATSNYPTQDLDMDTTGDEINIACIDNTSPSGFLDGYIAEMVYSDGQAYAASDFGEFDEDSPTIWKPIDVSGLTFGDNGFYLDFEDSANLGNDANGGTDFTTSGLAAIDQCTDSPTNNFAVANPLQANADTTFAEGNTWTRQLSSATAKMYAVSTIGMSAGKWYMEFKNVTNDNDSLYGITTNPNSDRVNNYYPGEQAHSFGFYGSDGNKYTGGSGSSYGSAASSNDIIGVALDITNENLYFSINGTWQDSGDPTSGATGTGAIDISGIGAGDGFYYFSAGSIDTSNYDNPYYNFGNPAFTISSGNADGNGYGNFEYAVPSGYYALCTKNLAEFGG